MVYLTKKDADKIAKELSNDSNKEIKNIIKKLKSPERRIYVRDKIEIKKLLQKAFGEKRKIKIRYYSPHNDENLIRVIEVYKIYKEAITAFCYLREEERNFIIERINSATLLDEKYKIPKNWSLRV